MLGYFLGHACCVADEEAPCIRALRDPTAEIFDGSISVPSSVEVLVQSKQFNGHCTLPAGPQERVIRTFATSEDEMLRGDALRTGSILQLKLGVAIEDITLTLYVNGFSRHRQGANQEEMAVPIGRTWSPFSLVEKCQVKTMQHSSLWAVFKLTVFRQEGDDRYYYFATTGKDAFRERDRWVEEISNAIRQVTLSLFPPHAITVRPLPGVDSTSTRIMAGYLLRSQATDVVLLYYCELHAYQAGGARLSIYKDEWCEREVAILMLTDQTVVSTRKGSYCTVFGVDQHRFCARTRDEKELWLRAVSNIKVKLMFDAPDPTSEELAVFRAAVLERIVKLEGSDDESHRQGYSPRDHDAWDPLLTLVPRPPLPQSPRGDIWNPEPMEDGETAEPPPGGRPLLANEMLAHSGPTDETVEGERVHGKKPNGVEESEGDCSRQLLTSVGPMVNLRPDLGCGAINSGIVASEHPGCIRTVHTTEKLLVAHQPPECDLPDEICDISCIADTHPRQLNGGLRVPRDPLDREVPETAPQVPLLMWSPGRRQHSQRAV
jgi:hypothetical protein